MYRDPVHHQLDAEATAERERPKVIAVTRDDDSLQRFAIHALIVSLVLAGALFPVLS
jgi:hypothetical protein